VVRIKYSGRQILPMVLQCGAEFCPTLDLPMVLLFVQYWTNRIASVCQNSDPHWILPFNALGMGMLYCVVLLIRMHPWGIRAKPMGIGYTLISILFERFLDF